MSDLTEYYVDPNLTTDTGDGSSGTPWGRTNTEVVQFALDNITRGVGGDRINIKVGAGARDIVPTGGYDITGTYGTPDANQPLYIQGYTTAAGDGGKGKIDVDAKIMFAQATTIDHITLWDLDVTDLNGTPGTPTNSVQLDRNISIVNCSFHGLTPTSAVIKLSINSSFMFNHVYNCTGSGIDDGCRWIYRNRFISGPTNEFGVAAIDDLSTDAVAMENIIHVTGSTHGIEMPNQASRAINNSIFSDGGTGHGINQGTTSTGAQLAVLNNVIEGFSDTSGVGINIEGSPTLLMKDGNAVQDCAVKYADSNTGVNYGTNEELSASPFTNVDTSNEDFSPVDTGSMKEGSRPPKIGEF